MEPLERHIIKNRKALDAVETPDIEAMWTFIEKEIPKASVKRSALIVGLRKIAVAASFMLIGGVAVWLYLSPQQKTPTTLAGYYPELAEKEKGYIQTIAQKEANIPFDSLDQFIFEDILEELSTLEDMKATTLKDLPRYTENERVVNALMRYYERKIQILERLSNEYQKNKHHERKREIQI
ncbi:MAG: hypothetical protein KDC85_14535 [Saprospiraceae bacterium]|nr:hypothetical protein [Saprospiraceae bacterium]MCB9325800.1 hypothetical protein [Lewinellaceae bacterium]